MIHFVYAGSHDDCRIQSPYPITANLYKFLKSRTEVAYYRWDSTDDIKLHPHDIILGHPNYDPNTPTQNAFKQTCRAKCLIHPFHHRRHNDNWPFNHLAIKADKIFAICGPYWTDSISKTPFAHWQPKITRLDMAVDSNIYPYLKTKFNQPGSRKLVYIGSATPNKNLHYLVRVMKALPHVMLCWYGGDSNHPLAKLPNVKTTGWVNLDQRKGQEICDACDIMISVSDSDANPTTLLETTAWGLIAACTKESGYYNDPMFTELHLDDFQRTISAITKLLNENSEQLMVRSKANRSIIETKYTWHRFCTTVWDGLQEYLQ